MKYDITYTCGHPGQINVVGPTKDRQYWIDREASKLCPECYEKQLEKDLGDLKVKWAERGLPELTGTTKQIIRADQDRDYAIEQTKDRLRIMAERAKRRPETAPEGFDEFVEHFDECLKLALQDATSASTWINDGFPLIKKAQTIWETQRNDVLHPEENAYRIAEPENKKTDNVAEIILYTAEGGGKYVKVISPKDSRIIDVCKAATYYWSGRNGCWMTGVTDRDTSPEDAQAYITAKLLEAGIPVKARASVIEMVFTGQYAPRQLRFIFYKESEDKYGICFPYGDDCTGNVRNMGARWDSYSSWYTLPGNEFRKIEDLVNLYGFGLSSKAKAHIEELSGITITVPTMKAKEQEKGAGLEAVLNSSRDVLEDLKDE